MMKKCTRCNKEKSLSDFYVKKRKGYKDGYCSRCKTCMNNLGRDYYSNNSEQIKRKNKISKLKSRHGLSEIEYNLILEAQNGLCALCKNPPTETSLCVDHEHGKGRIRGLLCSACNIRLGWLENNKDNIENYLKGTKWNHFQHPDLISLTE
jgi:hypothetical protein